jgi:hypothetical protein
MIQDEVHLKHSRNPSPNIKKKNQKHKNLAKTKNLCIIENLQKHEIIMLGILGDLR